MTNSVLMAQFCILITAVVTQTPTHVIKLHWTWYTHMHTATQMNVCKASESWMKFYWLSQFSFLVLPVSCGHIRCNHDEAKWWVSGTSPFAFNFPWTYHYLIFFFKYMLVLFKKGTSLVVQWLRFCAPTLGGLGLIPGQETIPYMPQVSVHMLPSKVLNTTTTRFLILQWR